MSTSDEEYEAKRQEFEDLSGWDAEVDPTLAVPPPDQFAVDRVRLEQRIVDALPPELLERWNAGDFRYQLTGLTTSAGGGSRSRTAPVRKSSRSAATGPRSRRGKISAGSNCRLWFPVCNCSGVSARGWVTASAGPNAEGVPDVQGLDRGVPK